MGGYEETPIHDPRVDALLELIREFPTVRIEVAKCSTINGTYTNVILTTVQLGVTKALFGYNQFEVTTTVSEPIDIENVKYVRVRVVAPKGWNISTVGMYLTMKYNGLSALQGGYIQSVGGVTPPKTGVTSDNEQYVQVYVQTKVPIVGYKDGDDVYTDVYVSSVRIEKPL